MGGLSLLERRADGDYSPDELPKQFPRFSPSARRADATTKSPWTLFESWVKARQPASSTITRWNGGFTNLESKFSGADAQPLTNDTAQAWSKPFSKFAGEPVGPSSSADMHRVKHNGRNHLV
jgi:hypothetical protein